MGQAEIRLFQGDITLREVDAIVNAANSFLQHGGGVAGAIVRAGGQIIQQESDLIGHVEVGSAAITGAGSLKALHVIHAVGPRMGEGDEEAKLESAIRSAIALADNKGLMSISVPAISSGIFGFPKDKCASILVRNAASFLKDNPGSSLRLVEFCVLDNESASYFEREIKRLGSN